MGRSISTFRKRDLAVALKALQEAGLCVAQVQVDKFGNLSILTTASHSVEQDEKQDEKQKDFDEWTPRPKAKTPSSGEA